MYKYTVSADKCVKGDLSYKAWMIIAAGAGGLIILILLFAVVIQCARRKRESSNPEKYVYDAGWVTSLRKERNSALYPNKFFLCLIWIEEIYFENVFVEFDNQFWLWCHLIYSCISVCCRYSDRETLVQDRSYDHIDQYHRKPSFKVEDRRIQTVNN